MMPISEQTVLNWIDKYLTIIAALLLLFILLGVDTFSFILAVFASFRVAQMVTLEDGPFDLFARWRDVIGVDKQETWIQRGFGCPDCVSLWTSFIVTFVLGATNPVLFTLHWFAIAGAVLFLNRMVVK